MITLIAPVGDAAAAGGWTLSHPDTTVAGDSTPPAGDTGVSEIVVNGERAGPAHSTWSVPSFPRARPRFAAEPLCACVICVHRPTEAVPAAVACAAPAASAVRSAATALTWLMRMLF